MLRRFFENRAVIHYIPENLILPFKQLFQSYCSLCEVYYPKTFYEHMKKVHNLEYINYNNKKEKNKISREFHEDLSKSISEYSEKCRIPKERENMINFVCEKLTKILRQYPQYDDVIIKPFGSSVNGFGTPTSDLDLCIVTSSKLLNKDEKKERIEKLAEVLNKEGYLNINDSKKYIIIIIILEMLVFQY